MSWCQQQMNVVRHDGERVEFELVGVAIAKEGLQEEIGVRFDLEVMMLEEG